MISRSKPKAQHVGTPALTTRCSSAPLADAKAEIADDWLMSERGVSRIASTARIASVMQAANGRADARPVLAALRFFRFGLGRPSHSKPADASLVVGSHLTHLSGRAPIPDESDSLILTPCSSAAAAMGDAKMAYTCPMHPKVRRNAPGKCPKCGTDLVPVGTTPHARGRTDSGSHLRLTPHRSRTHLSTDVARSLA